MYALGYIASFENKERSEIMLIGRINNVIEVSVNNKVIGSSKTEEEAKEIVMEYMEENP